MINRINLLVWLAALGLLASCSSSASPEDSRPPIPVSVGEVEKGEFPIYVEAIGKLAPKASVAVKAKVSGTLKEAPVPEGNSVKQGELLFRFGSSSYEARLDRAEANLFKTEANLAFFKNKLTRYLTLKEKEYVTELSIEELQKDVAEQEALIRGYKVEVELAKMDLDDTRIAAPMDGILGEKKIGVFNSVEKGALLSTLVQIDQLYVDFYLAEKFFIPLIRAMKKKNSFDIEVKASDGTMADGRLTFVDTTVNPNTGTILARGLIDNSSYFLQPGQYVNVRLKLRDMENATILPLSAVQLGPQGHYVYIVHPDDTVALQIVHPVYQTRKAVVVSEDLERGQKVATNGHMNLVPGAKVVVIGEGK